MYFFSLLLIFVLIKGKEPGYFNSEFDLHRFDIILGGWVVSFSSANNCSQTECYKIYAAMRLHYKKTYTKTQEGLCRDNCIS